MLVRDNDPQFTGNDMKWFLEELHIEQRFASVWHAQTNKQVEAANKDVLDGLTKIVNALEDNWADEMENVLLSIQTKPKTLTKETPFCLVYGAEAVAQWKSLYQRIGQGILIKK